MHQAPKSHKSLLVDFEYISFQFLLERRQTHAFVMHGVLAEDCSMPQERQPQMPEGQWLQCLSLE